MYFHMYFAKKQKISCEKRPSLQSRMPSNDEGVWSTTGDPRFRHFYTTSTPTLREVVNVQTHKETVRNYNSLSNFV